MHLTMIWTCVKLTCENYADTDSIHFGLSFWFEIRPIDRQELDFRLANHVGNCHFHFGSIQWRHLLQRQGECGAPRHHFIIFVNFSRARQKIIANIVNRGHLRGCVSSRWSFFIRSWWVTAFEYHIRWKLRVSWCFMVNQNPIGSVCSCNGWFGVSDAAMMLFDVFVQFKLARVLLLAFTACEFRFFLTVLRQLMLFQSKRDRKNFTAFLATNEFHRFADCQMEQREISNYRKYTNTQFEWNSPRGTVGASLTHFGQKSVTTPLRRKRRGRKSTFAQTEQFLALAVCDLSISITVSRLIDSIFENEPKAKDMPTKTAELASENIKNLLQEISWANVESLFFSLCHDPFRLRFN